MAIIVLSILFFHKVAENNNDSKSDLAPAAPPWKKPSVKSPVKSAKATNLKPHLQQYTILDVQKVIK